MQLPPVDVYLSWPAPNYKDPVVRGSENMVMNIIFFVLVILVVSIRMFTRLRISKSFGADDWLILVAVVPTIAFAIISLVVEIDLGWNRHIWDVKLDTMTAGMKIVMSLEVLFTVATTFTKLSMLTLIYRVVGAVPGRMPKFIIAVMGFCILECLIFGFSTVFQCGLPSKYFTPSFKPQPECISEVVHLLAHGIFNTITDFVVVLIPMPTVWHLRLPLQQQIVIASLFSAGLLVTAAGAVRTVYTYKVTVGWDKTWLAFPVRLASGVELYLGIICASVPPTKKFFSRYVPKWIGYSGGSQSEPNSSSDHHRRGAAMMNLAGEENDIGVFPLQKVATRKGQFSESQTWEGSISSDDNCRKTLKLERAGTSSRRSLGTEMVYENRLESQEELVVSHDSVQRNFQQSSSLNSQSI